MGKKGDVKLRYGVRDGKIICITELTPEDDGLACNCICPQCGGKLEARLGNRNQHHFAHHDEKCDIDAAQQTALHLLAKEIIKEKKEILFPGFNIDYADVFPGEKRYADIAMQISQNTLSHEESSTHICDSVEVEKPTDNFIPDIEVVIRKRSCFVEIAVTHFADETKKEKIRQSGISAMEIDMSSFYRKEKLREEIEKAILSEEGNREWLYNKKREANIVELRNKYGSKLDQKKRDEMQKYIELREKAAKKSQKEKKTRENLKVLFQSDNYRRQLDALRNDRMVEFVVGACNFSRALNGSLPFYMDIPVTGEMVFQCDRRVWESILFDRFIYNSREYKADICIADIKNWIWDNQNRIPIDRSLYSKITVEIGGKRKTFELVHDVINQYLLYMYKLGFISELACGNAVVEKWHTITAPNSENSERLREALRGIDLYSPNVNSLIEKAMLKK